MLAPPFRVYLGIAAIELTLVSISFVTTRPTRFGDDEEGNKDSNDPDKVECDGDSPGSVGEH